MSFEEEYPNFRYVGLPKWPALVVEGDPVTPEQAMEILIRTDPWYVSVNDREWERIVYELMGLPMEDQDDTLSQLRAKWDLKDNFRREFGVLELEYLYNSQIASAYVGGPHGWCDWNGRIGTSNYNIGKWPIVEAVWSDWVKIAEAFPYLNLWSQLYSGEQCEEHSHPVIEFVVSGGKVKVQDPTEHEIKASYPDQTNNLMAIAYGWHGRERGCSAQKLAEAINYVRKIRNSNYDSVVNSELLSD
jgi:hypothetical protein